MNNQILQILFEPIENIPRTSEENNTRYRAMAGMCSR